VTPDPADPAGPEAIPADERESAWGLLRRGEALLAAGHAAAAATVLERAARSEPGRASIVEPLARALNACDRLDDAEAAFRELLALEPASAWAHHGLAVVLRRRGQVAEARTHLRLACALAPDSAVYRAALARSA